MLKIVSKTVAAVEYLRMTITDLEVLIDDNLIVPPLEGIPTMFRRSDKVKWFWLEYEVKDMARLLDTTKAPTREEYITLRDKHLATRDRMEKQVNVA